MKQIAKSRRIKDYKKKSKKYLRRTPSISQSKITLFKKKIKNIKNDFCELKHGFSKSKTSELMKSLYNIKIQTNLFPTKRKETQKSLYDLKKYYGDTQEIYLERLMKIIKNQ